jgi:hypothetical protein
MAKPDDEPNPRSVSVMKLFDRMPPELRAQMREGIEDDTAIRAFIDKFLKPRPGEYVKRRQEQKHEERKRVEEVIKEMIQALEHKAAEQKQQGKFPRRA